MFDVHLLALLAYTAQIVGGTAVIAVWATASYCSPEAQARRAADVALQQVVARNREWYAVAYARAEEAAEPPADEELGTFRPRIWWELICVTVAALAGQVFRRLRDAVTYTGSHRPRPGETTTSTPGRHSYADYDELMEAAS